MPYEANSLLAANVVGVAQMLPCGHFLSNVIFAWLSIDVS